MMDLNKLKQEWLKEENHAFSGWDFSHLDGRRQSQDPPWDYLAVVREYLKETDALLDMGTGGGEVLLSLGHPHRLTYVTEAYPPNVKLCRERLSPLGITVKQIEDDSEIPYPDESFDVVMNRHEAFDVSEVHRVLKRGGFFITQQVGGENDRRLSELLIPGFEPPFSEHTASHNVALLQHAGFEILDSREAFLPVKYTDVGAIVYFAKILPWEFPGFSVEASFEALCECRRIIEQNGFLEDIEHRFLIAARKTGKEA